MKVRLVAIIFRFWVCFLRGKNTLNFSEIHGIRRFFYLGLMSSNRHVLRRPRHGRAIAGVLAGIARFYGVGVTPLRLLVFILALAFGTGILAYLIAWAIIPEE